MEIGILEAIARGRTGSWEAMYPTRGLSAEGTTTGSVFPFEEPDTRIPEYPNALSVEESKGIRNAYLLRTGAFGFVVSSLSVPPESARLIGWRTVSSPSCATPPGIIVFVNVSLSCFTTRWLVSSSLSILVAMGTGGSCLVHAGMGAWRRSCRDELVPDRTCVHHTPWLYYRCVAIGAHESHCNGPSPSAPLVDDS